MFPTKTDDAKRGHESFSRLSDVAYQLWRRKDAGYAPTKAEMMPVEFEAMLMFNDLISDKERIMRGNMVELLEIAANVKRG
jgi:hypothetical protein